MSGFLEPGSIFAGDYRIVRPLSHGGMGAIYVVEQLSTRMQRALKVMRAELLEDDSARRRFEQEARIAAGIPSEHIVQVQAAGVEPSSRMPYLVMELLEGETLDEMVRRRGALPPLEIRQVMGQICHAVGAAHAAGIVHRDLKPANVFMAASRRTDAAFTVKVLDFGIAKLLSENSATTAAIGSPLWLAPEQTERSPITPATDVWALGLIAYFLATGRSFWRSAYSQQSSVTEVMREILIDPIPPASQRSAEVGCGLPSGFDGWFGYCVARDASRRFSTATQAFTALAPLLDVATSQGAAHAPPGAVPSGGSYPAGAAPNAAGHAAAWHNSTASPAGAWTGSAGTPAGATELASHAFGREWSGEREAWRAAGPAAAPGSTSGWGPHGAGFAATAPEPAGGRNGGVPLGCWLGGAAAGVVLLLGLVSGAYLLGTSGLLGSKPTPVAASVAEAPNPGPAASEVASIAPSAALGAAPSLQPSALPSPGQGAAPTGPRPAVQPTAPAPSVASQAPPLQATATSPQATAASPQATAASPQVAATAAPAAQSPPAPAAQPSVRIRTLLGGNRVSDLPADAQSQVRSREPRWRACYSRALGGDLSPRSDDTMILWLTIAANGSISRVETRIDKTPAGVGTCVVPLVQSMRMQPPQNPPVPASLIITFSAND